MYIIKLDAIDSTNSYLKTLATRVLPKDYTVVTTNSQRMGRGQMGTNWQSRAGENLTVSVFKGLPNFKIQNQFFISMAVALAICKTLESFKIPKVKIKWPNDILSANKKVCGILIENVIKNNQFQGTIIGFGLNVNQKFFDDLPQASSMHLLSGIVYDKDEILSKVLKNLRFYIEKLEAKNHKEIKSEYEAHLFRKDKPSTFKLNDNSLLSGIIKGVEDQGKLNVWTEDEIIKTFDIKDITLLY